MTDFRFGVLGPLEVARAGRQVHVPAGRRRAVLACLIVHAGRPVSPDLLIDAAWRDCLPVDPRASLHTVLSRLRSALGGEVIAAHPAGYRLDVAEGAVDADRFEALRRQAAAAPAEQATGLLDAAMALWRGRAYDGFEDRDFAAPEAQRLEQLHLDAIEDRAAAGIDAGEAAAPIVELSALLAQHPYRERAMALLMTALYTAGRPVEALARHRRYCRLLRDELGLDPSPRLRRLETQILTHTLRGPRR